jgi:MFS family permease
MAPSSDALTARERGVMWQHRILNVAWELKFGVSSSSLMLKLLALSQNDTAVIAQANSIHWAVNGFLQLFGTPIAGALSDSIGRKPLWALGRATKLIWFMGSMCAFSVIC